MNLLYETNTYFTLSTCLSYTATGLCLINVVFCPWHAKHLFHLVSLCLSTLHSDSHICCVVIYRYTQYYGCSGCYKKYCIFFLLWIYSCRNVLILVDLCLSVTYFSDTLVYIYIYIYIYIVNFHLRDIE